jgi:putative toxin-antitoxin system antitoxin component (TIGR02293 family)
MAEPKPYKFLEDDEVNLTNIVREGISFLYLARLSNHIHFEVDEWASYLHLSERTIHRYKKENKTFDPIYSEKIVMIELLYKRGIEVFGDEEKFYAWMDYKSIPLGGVKPKELLDTVFGINMIRDELGRIEHGILA